MIVVAPPVSVWNGRRMIWLKIVMIVFMTIGLWRSVKAMGRPVLFEGRRYFRQPDGRYRRWYGGSAKKPEDIGLEGP